MVVVPDRFLPNSRLAQIGLAFAAGGLAASGQAPMDFGFPTVLGLTMAGLLFMGTKTPKQAFRFGWTFGFGYFALALNWIVEPFFVDAAATGWMAPFALVFLSGGLALFWGVAMGGARRFGNSLILWAIAMALAEMLRAYLFTGFPWAMPSYAWVNSVAALSAAWIGPHGANLLLFLAAAGLANLLARRSYRVFAGALLGLLVVSLVPAPFVPASAAGPVLRLVQPNAPQDEKWQPDRIDVFYQRQLAFSAAPGDPDFVIWPETAVALPLPNATRLFPDMARAAGDAQIITGIQRWDGPFVYNSLVVLNTLGDVEQIYDKHHLVPFGEYLPLGNWLGRIGLRGLAAEDGAGFAAGAGPQTLALRGIGAVLPLICYEAVFPQDLRSGTRPRLLLQITNDAWFGEFFGPYQHLAQARMRAIEQGLPMVRVANTGVSAVIDARGRIVDRIPLGQAGYLDATLPRELAKTLYARTGDKPILIVLLLSCLLTAVGFKRKSIDGSGRQIY